MTLIATLGHALGFSLAAGVNLYATVGILGLASRFGWVDLPQRFAMFDSTIVIAVASALYMVEFFADKIPWVDSAWDAMHTAIRPVGGALVAVASMGEMGDGVTMADVLMAVLGGSVAAGAHLTKASTRAAVNASPEPVSNWVLSISEDLFVVGLGTLAINYPVAAFAVASVLILLILCFLGVITRTAWRWFSRRRGPVAAAG
jgi:hypothetical protein